MDKDVSRSLDGLVVLITGAGNGVGKATAIMAAERGAKLALLDREERSLDAVVTELNGLGIDPLVLVADTTNENEIRSAFASAASSFGRIDVVLHVAGIMRGQRLDIRDLTEEIWDEVINVNLKGSFLVSKYAATHILAQGSGTLVLVASRSGISVPSGSIAYGASKGGIQGLAMSLSRQLGPLGLRVHTLCPGDVDTPLMRASLDEALSNGANPAEIAVLRASLGKPEDIAKALLHLADPAASALFGTIFTI
jgi:NAD(P)-dependent dehydrogenase (short-subunit alcohol dehydrogenase family)